MIRNIAALLLFFISTIGHSQECEKLQGTFQSIPRRDYEPFNLIIEQDGCQSITVTRDFYRVPHQIVMDAIFDGEIYDEDMFGFVFSRKYFWVDNKAHYTGKLYDQDGKFYYNVQGQLILDNNGIMNFIEYYDDLGNFLTRDIEFFVK
jgi:hypothetical protein